MDYQGLTYANKDNIGIITLNRPERLNPLSAATNTSIQHIVDELESDQDTRVLVITGAGRAFSAGADVTELAASVDSGRPGMDIGLSSTPISYISDLRRLNQPVIAAINGLTAGMALSVALACDIRIAAASAQFIAAWIRRGFIPDAGGTFLMPRAIGMGKALEMALTGDAMDAAEALRVGFVNRVVPDDELMPTAMELAQRLAAGPPLAIARAKKALYHAQDMSLEGAVDHELYNQSFLMRTADFAEGVKAFLEKRKANFVGR